MKSRAVFIGVVLALLLGAWFCWPKTESTSETALTPKVARPSPKLSAQIAAPVLAPVAKDTTANAEAMTPIDTLAPSDDPRPGAHAAIVKIIDSLNANDVEGYFNACVPKGEQANMAPEIKAKVLADFRDLMFGPRKDAVLKLLEQIKEQKALSEGHPFIAVYVVPGPTPDGTGVMAVTFINDDADGYWVPSKWPEIKPSSVIIDTPVFPKKQ